MMTHLTKGRLALTLVASCAGVARANYGGTRHVSQLQELIALSPSEVLNSLDDYDQFWVEAWRGSCVWSECAVDDTDDAYLGDNRDGDEQWYQYRTQNFCANAAYSLYGRKKGEGWSYGSGGCSRKHYINSYFTYGGADTLLTNLGMEPEIYYGGNEDGDDDSSSSNAYCVELDDYEPSDSNEEEDAEEEEEAQEGEERKLKRRLSESQDNGGYSSTLGCSENGDYVISVFESNSCDGNYFLESLDTIDSYNYQHAIGCQQIMKSDGGDVSVEVITQLLSNSWTCDVRMYPSSCPDPFGQKANWEYALRTAARGGNAMWAYKNMIYKRPVKAITHLIVCVSVAIIALAYLVKYRHLIRVNCANGQRGLFEGSLKVVKENVGETVDGTKVAVRKYFKKHIRKQRAAKKEMSKSGTEKEEEPESPKSPGSTTSGRAQEEEEPTTAAQEEEPSTAAEEGNSKSLYVSPPSPDQQPSTMSPASAKSPGSTKSWRENKPEFDYYGNVIDEDGGVMA